SVSAAPAFCSWSRTPGEPCALPIMATCWPPVRSCSPAADAICSRKRGSLLPTSGMNQSRRRRQALRRTNRTRRFFRLGIYREDDDDGGLTVDLGLQGRRAAISASSGGLGFATAAALAAEGAVVTLSGTHEGRLQAAAKRIGP